MYDVNLQGHDGPNRSESKRKQKIYTKSEYTFLIIPIKYTIYN